MSTLELREKYHNRLEQHKQYQQQREQATLLGDVPQPQPQREQHQKIIDYGNPWRGGTQHYN